MLLQKGLLVSGTLAASLLMATLPAQAMQLHGPLEGVERPATGYYAAPRVEFAFDDMTRVRLVEGVDFKSAMKWEYEEIEDLLQRYAVEDLRRLFDQDLAKLDELKATGEARTGKTLPDLANWYTCILPDEHTARELAAKLAESPFIRSASATGVPIPHAVDIAPTTPNYEPSQDYHDAAPYGVGIASAWAEPNGTGTGVNVLHYEGDWTLDHENYDVSYEGGGQIGSSNWINHGTACLSILGANDGGYGVTGLAHGADGLYCYGIDGGSSGWINATNSLNPGDVISASWGWGGSLPGGYSCSCNPGQTGSQPAESNQADFDAISSITANGYIVVNSAANGCVPMDNALYGGIYDLNQRDSGALIIGAIDPGGDPSCFTNYGSRIDAHSWGSSVYSAGYGDLFTGGGDDRQYYTSDFGGTSAACPIVSGAIAALQAVYKQRNGGDVLDPWELRTLLRTTGTPQASQSGSKPISNQPDLEELLDAIGGGGPDVTPPSISHTPLENTGDESGPYIVEATITDPSSVTSASLFYRVDGGSYTQTAMSGSLGNYVGVIPGQSAGSVIDYYIRATDGADPSNTGDSSTWSFTILSTTNGIVLLTPSGSAYSSGSEWEAALSAAGYGGTIMNVDNLDGIVLGPSTDALVVLLGIYSNNFVVDANSAMANAIVDFANSGGNVYLEGGDVWYYDPASAGGHDFGPTFGIDGDADGTGDLSTTTGQGILGGTFAYSGENAWIDRLTSTGADLLFSNDAAGYNCGYSQNGVRTTAGTSFELAGLSGFDGIVSTLFGSALYDVLNPADNTPPSITHTCLGDPLDLAPRLVTAFVTDPSGVAEVNLLARVNGGAYSSSAMLPTGGGSYEGVLSVGSWNDTVEYFIEAIDASPNSNAGASPVCDYQLPAPPDLTPPAIVLDCLENTQDEGARTVLATVTDASGLSSVVLFVRLNGGAWGDYPMNPAGGDVYERDIVVGTFGDTVEYYVEAVDASSNANSAASGLCSYDLLLPPQLSYDPLFLIGVSVPGGGFTQPVNLFNNGDADLDWNLELVQDPLPALARSTEIQAPLRLRKGQEDSRPGQLPNDAGGPDAGGYVWSDSNEPGGPVADFQSISAGGTALGMSDDQTQGPFALGFPFEFYGQSYSDVYVCSNGFACFLPNSELAYTNQAIPDGAEPHGMVAPFWDDLNPANGGEVYTQAFPDRFVIEWNSVPHYPNTGSYTFQAILHDDGSIEYQYELLDGDENSCTIGIENASSDIATQIVFNNAYVTDNFAIRIERESTETIWLSATPLAGTLGGGTAGAFQVLMDGADLGVGVYTGEIRIHTNEPLTHTIPVTFVLNAADSEGPVITHDCLEDSYSTDSRPLTVTTSDASTVAQVDLSYSVDGNPPVSVGLSSGDGLSWSGSLPGQAAGSSVEYTLSAFDEYMNGTTTDPCSFQILELAAPVLSIENLGANTIHLSWTAVPGASSYLVQSASELGGSFSTVLTTPLTEVSFGAPADTKAIYQVVPQP